MTYRKVKIRKKCGAILWESLVTRSCVSLFLSFSLIFFFFLLSFSPSIYLSSELLMGMDTDPNVTVRSCQTYWPAGGKQSRPALSQ